MSGPGGSILLADVEGPPRAALAERLRAEHHAVTTAATVDEIMDGIVGGAPDLLLVDLKLSGGDPVALLKRVRRADPDLAVVLLIAVGQADRAVVAMEGGAADYLVKPVDPVELSLVVARELERRRLRRETAAARERLAERYRFPGVIGEAPAMQQLYKAMVQIAVMPAAVLITGEPGTGKALIAAAIHGRSPRARMQLVRLTPDTPVAAVCQAASGGSLFVEEITDLSPAGQLELAHLLEEPAGRAAARQPTFDVRILAATGRDLHAEVDRGRFRSDLRDCLRGLHLRVPPLRERASDVPALAIHFLQKHAARAGRAAPHFDREVMDRLRSYSWPGNVRELEAVIERAVAMSGGTRVTAAELLPELRAFPMADGIQIPGWTLDQLERHAILETMNATGGSTGKTARLLGISVRNVQYKLRAYRTGVEAPHLRAVRGGNEKVA
jgi:DNA-binding NtrC family response regulator